MKGYIVTHTERGVFGLQSETFDSVDKAIARGEELRTQLGLDSPKTPWSVKLGDNFKTIVTYGGLRFSINGGQRPFSGQLVKLVTIMVE